LKEEPSKLHMNTFRRNLQLATLDNLDSLDRLITRLGLDILDLLHDIVALEDLAKHDVTAVEPTVTLSVSK